MKRITGILLLAATLATGASCKKEQLAITYSNQEARIDKYIESEVGKDPAITVTYNGGASRMTRVQGEGTALSADGHVSFHYAGYVFNGSVSATSMFATNHQATAEQAGWNLTESDFSLFDTGLSDKKLLEGLRKGLEGVRAGEECEIMFSGKYGYGNKTFGIIPANSALLYKIWVVGVSNE